MLFLFFTLKTLAKVNGKCNRIPVLFYECHTSTSLLDCIKNFNFIIMCVSMCLCVCVCVFITKYLKSISFKQKKNNNKCLQQQLKNYCGFVYRQTLTSSRSRSLSHAKWNWILLTLNLRFKFLYEWRTDDNLYFVTQ